MHNADVRVVFVLNEYVLHNHVLTDFVRARPNDGIAVVKVPLVLKGRDRLDTARRVLPRLSRRFAFSKALEFAVLLALVFVPKLLSRGAVFLRLRKIARRHGLAFHKTNNIMAPESLEFLRAQEPDLVVTLFHQIIKQPLLDIPHCGVINIHPGLIPEFRGMQPYFWELSEGHGRAGPSLHIIEDEGIDTGSLLTRASYAIEPGMSVQLNYYLTMLVAARLLPRCAEGLRDGELRGVPQDVDAGAYYRWPDSAAFDNLTARGHRLFSWRGLWSILGGNRDHVAAGAVTDLSADRAVP